MSNQAAPRVGAAHTRPPHVSETACFPLGDGWVVTDASADRLLVLNHTARVIWELWRDGDDADAIARTLSRRYAVDETVAAKDAADAIARWSAAAPPETAPARDRLHPRQATLDRLPAAPTDRPVEHYRIHGMAVGVWCADDAIRRAVAPLLAHLATAPYEAPAATYRIERLGADLRLRQDERVIYQGPSLDLVTVNLLNELQLAAFRDRDNLCVLHAAAVGRADRCVLLPGVAGAGKSTLTAALLDHGLDYLSDDTVPIDATGRAVALTPPLCLKAGSVEVLRERYPELPGLPVYQRVDQPVRYLPPPAGVLHGQPTRRVRALVFPHYRPGSDAGLTPMPATEAFALLVSAGVFAYQPRDPAQIAALVAWFGGLASYALAYDDLDDACGLVREALDAGTDAPLRQPYPRAKP